MKEKILEVIKAFWGPFCLSSFREKEIKGAIEEIEELDEEEADELASQIESALKEEFVEKSRVLEMLKESREIVLSCERKTLDIKREYNPDEGIKAEIKSLKLAIVYEKVIDEFYGMCGTHLEKFNQFIKEIEGWQQPYIKDV